MAGTKPETKFFICLFLIIICFYSIQITNQKEEIGELQNILTVIEEHIDKNITKRYDPVF